MRAPSVQTLLAHFRDLTKKDAILYLKANRRSL